MNRFSWLLLTLLALCGVGTAEEDTDSFDILGFRLGMTPEEAKSAFRKLNPDIQLKTHRAHYRYSDGLQDFQTDDFLERISGTIRFDPATKAMLHITVEFAPPPEGGRAVQIERQDSNIANPVTLAEYKEALVGKYGPPATERYGLQWHFPHGRSLCSTSADGPVASHLNALAQGEQKLANPSQCASYLTFRMTGEPVTEVYARMVDVENAIRAHLAASAWVADLEAKAVAARKAKGKGPEL